MSSMTEASRNALGNQGMEQMINVVNQLQDAFTSLGLPLTLDLPQIAVVGCQSAGKSSVLENVVGRDFLPRGSGIVTRRPLVLQLINHPSEYAEFLHIRDRRFTDFNEVRKEIDRETDRLLGPKKSVSSVPINLRVYSPNVLNLTLIDLPGLTKNPVGDQPRDIVDQIRNMVLDYISRDNCLILAVSPANTDLANSDALSIAREVDPQGLRTVGVITKLDLMDQGTDARDVLENKVLPLRRGYIGVVNRSQRDIENNRDIKSTIEAERRFFADHPAYRHLSERNGTLYLQRALNQQLTEHIRDRLPSLRSELHSKLMAMEKEVSELRDGDENGRRRQMNHLIHIFSSDFEQAIYGSDADILNNSLNAGAKINRIFHSKFPLELTKLTFDKRKLHNEISYAIWNNEAVRTSLFTPHAAFEAVVRGQVQRILEPCYRCVDMVLVEVLGAVNKCTVKMQRYPRLQIKCERIAIQKTRECEQACKQQLKILTDMQLAYINTNHKDFIGFNEASQIDNAPPKQPQKPTANQVWAKGYLTLHNVSFLKGGSKEAWFVLTTESLSWYADEREENRKFQLPVTGLKYRDLSTSANKCMFALYAADGRPVYNEYKQLELSCSNAEQKDAWKDAFFHAGVTSLDPTASPSPSTSSQRSRIDSVEDALEVDDALSTDHIHRRRVETIARFVESYMSIVHKSTLDMVPKAVMLTVIAELKKFFATEFHIAVSMSEADLMRESPEEAEYRDNMLKTFAATQKALSVINDVCAKGISIPKAAPVHRNYSSSSIVDPKPPAQPTRPAPRLAPKPAAVTSGQPAVPV